MYRLFKVHYMVYVPDMENQGNHEENTLLSSDLDLTERKDLVFAHLKNKFKGSGCHAEHLTIVEVPFITESL